MNTLPFKSVIFDLDGVVTQTALVHSRAWKEMFDGYLRARQGRDGGDFREFTDQDYLTYVDGKPRYEGVKSFLESRDIHIPYGAPKDPPDKETVCGLGNKKNDTFRQVLSREKPKMYPTTVELIKKLKEQGIKIGVASSSKNCQFILQAAGIEELFEARVDGVVSVELGLKGKPEGDIFVRAAAHLETLPAESVVVEDAESGIAAGRNGGFRLVIGIARNNNQKELLENGADVVVDDLGGIDIEWIKKWFMRPARPLLGSSTGLDQEIPDVTVHPAHLRSPKGFPFGKEPVFFLDYDGTLTPIVERPELAVLTEEMRGIVKRLSQKYQTAIVSGRMREDVEKLVAIDGLFYAGSHGFDIKGPDVSLIEPQAEKTLALVAEVIKKLKKELGSIEKLLVEEKKFSVAVHYRCVDPKDHAKIKPVIDNILAGEIRLRVMEGKMVYEILPAIDWNKGKAIRWIMNALGLSWNTSQVVYIGDDVTDEDAFRVVATRGVPILVHEEARPTAADFYLKDPGQVQKFFETLLT
ncbi:MAG: trehalose-phosphatase [Candidatus Omnitrophica bacterium]|nr:trehalose-phosphatase [Candidatus Omnitrophota bacterium]